MPSELAAKIVSEMGSLPATWANTIDGGLQKVREVLESTARLNTRDGHCWCKKFMPTVAHEERCERARALMVQLRVDGAS